MSANNKVSTKIGIAKTELEATINMRLNEFKSETVSAIDMKLSILNSNKFTSSYNQPSADLIKWTLLKLPGKYSHVSQFTTNLYSIILKVDNLFKIQEWWDSILSAFYQYLSTNKIWPR